MLNNGTCRRFSLTFCALARARHFGSQNNKALSKTRDGGLQHDFKRRVSSRKDTFRSADENGDIIARRPTTSEGPPQHFKVLKIVNPPIRTIDNHVFSSEERAHYGSSCSPKRDDDMRSDFRKVARALKFDEGETQLPETLLKTLDGSKVKLDKSKNEGGTETTESQAMSAVSREKWDNSIEHLDFKLSCSKKIATIHQEELVSSKYKVKRSKAEVICSYNCDDSGNLYIPGMSTKYFYNIRLTTSLGAPSRYKDPALPLALKRDFTFQTPLTQPGMWSHLWNAFEAIETLQPSFDFSKIDIVCSMQTLIVLLDFAYGTVDQRGFNTRLVKQTLFVDRFEPQKPTYEKFADMNFGKEFAAATTVPETGVPANAQYFQWISYPIGNLSCAVLVEVNAWKAHLHKAPTKTASQLSESSPAKHVPGILVSKVGREIPRELFVNLITTKTNYGPSQNLPQYYFGRISRFMSGLQQQSHFKSCTVVSIRRIKENNPGKSINRWKMVPTLQKLVTLLESLRDATQQSKQNACIAFTDGTEAPQRLEVHEPEFNRVVLDERQVPKRYHMKEKFLSKSVIEQFWKGREKEFGKRKIEGMRD
jgi:hypothetical protein